MSFRWHLASCSGFHGSVSKDMSLSLDNGQGIYTLFDQSVISGIVRHDVSLLFDHSIISIDSMTLTTRSPWHCVCIAVLITTSMLDREGEFFQDLQPPTLLSYGFRHLPQPRQSRVIMRMIKSLPSRYCQKYLQKWTTAKSSFLITQ